MRTPPNPSVPPDPNVPPDPSAPQDPNAVRDPSASQDPGAPPDHSVRPRPGAHLDPSPLRRRLDRTARRLRRALQRSRTLRHGRLARASAGPLPESGGQAQAAPAAAPAVDPEATQQLPRIGDRRTWSIRAKILSMMLVPLLALVAMWALATTVTLGAGLKLYGDRNTASSIDRPVQELIVSLQAERLESLRYLSGGTNSDQAPMLELRVRTDTAAAAVRSGAHPGGNEVISLRLDELLRQLDALIPARDSIDRGEVDRTGTFGRYTQVIEAGLMLRSALRPASDDELVRAARALVTLDRAREVLAEEDALLTSQRNGAKPSSAELMQLAQLVGIRRYLATAAIPDLEPVDRVAYETLAGVRIFNKLAAMENRIVTTARGAPASPVDVPAWTETYEQVDAQLREFEADAAQRLADRGAPGWWVVVGQLIVAGLLGLVTVVVTVIASIRIGRGLIRRLAGLRQAALELAIDRLPRVVRRLRAGDEVDVESEAPPLPYSDDEIGQVGHALNELQRTAVGSAVEEAAVRHGLNEVFLNIARRSQTLLHQQLSILDGMERRTEQPAELEDLFRVDHLATRMRRHAEDLVILAGAAPGRGWRQPVPVVDVLRGAVSEVEEYARVSVRPMPELSIQGRAVGDMIHLLAELIENATTFSPPHTRVNIGVEIVTHGLAIEIEDRGLGLKPADLAAVNERLANPSEFDPNNSAQLGLFVVARLAARHSIKAQLRSSPYGGITAVVLLPQELLSVGAEPVALTAGSELVVEEIGPGRGGTGRVYRALSVGPRPAIGSAPVGVTPVDSGDDTTMDIRGSSGPRPAMATPEEEALTEDGLPKRMRQASVAPPAGPAIPRQAGGPGREPEEHPDRSPEQVRDLMTSFQAGTQRGRGEDGDSGDEPTDPGGAAAAGTHETDRAAAMDDGSSPSGPADPADAVGGHRTDPPAGRKRL